MNQITLPSGLGLLFVFTIVVVFASLLYYELNCRPKIQNISDVSDIQIETGDLLLVSTHAHHPMFFGLLQRNAFLQVTGGGGEWNHVALIVVIGNEPFVYNTCPFNPRSVPYDFTVNSRKDSGFVHLSKYINALHGYVGIRKLNRSFLSHTSQPDHLFLTVMQNHNQRMKYSLNLLTCAVSLFLKSQINVVKGDDEGDDEDNRKYEYNCCEAVAKIYSDVGISYDKFYIGMSLRPLVDMKCPLFGPVTHIRPGPKVGHHLQKYFDKQ